MQISAAMKVARKAARHVADQILGEGPAARQLYQSQLTLAAMEREQATALLIDGLAKAAGDEPKVYVSTPITGGERLYEFLSDEKVTNKKQLDPSDIPAYNRKVIEANCSHASKIADKLRAQGVCALEPSSIQLPGWSQTRYNQNWVEVVNKVSLDKVVVCDGWQLSYGCLLEVRCALDKGIPVVDEDNQIIDRAQALARVQASSAQLAGQGFELGNLSRALTEPMASLPMEF